jgi:hypothetical protein
MKTIDQMLEMISNEKQIVIAVRGDYHEYEYLDYTKNSMHKDDNMDVAVELEGTCALKVWEYGQSVEDMNEIELRLQELIEFVKSYGPHVHIIACEVNQYEYGWDETDYGQEIIMKDAWVISNNN